LEAIEGSQNIRGDRKVVQAKNCRYDPDMGSFQPLDKFLVIADNRNFLRLIGCYDLNLTC